MRTTTEANRLVAEGLGTAGLLTAVVGSGIVTATDGPAATLFGEAVATAGLLLVIFALVHTDRTRAIPAAVGAWIGAAIFFTASAAFANPAVTMARALTDTWTGIAPSSVPGFLAGQGLGVVLAVPLISWLYAPTPAEAHDVVVPHESHDGHPRGGAAPTTGARP